MLFHCIRWSWYLFISLVFIYGCSSGKAFERGGPGIAEAQGEAALGPKARIAVARFVNNTGDEQSQAIRIAMQQQAEMPDIFHRKQSFMKLFFYVIFS